MSSISTGYIALYADDTDDDTDADTSDADTDSIVPEGKSLADPNLFLSHLSSRLNLPAAIST
jgi:hypothetical protein